MTNRPALMLTALVVISAAACGTTVPQGATPDSLSGALGAPTAAAAAGAESGAEAITAGALPGAKLDDGVARSGGEAPVPVARDAPAPGTAPGVQGSRGSSSADHSPVEVGVYILKNFDRFAGSAGRGAYASSFDQQSHASSLAADLN